MWISQVELTCFKGYRHQVFSFPKPENGRNIVLIGGMARRGAYAQSLPAQTSR
jgi:hypothetical protein